MHLGSLTLPTLSQHSNNVPLPSLEPKNSKNVFPLALGTKRHQTLKKSKDFLRTSNQTTMAIMGMLTMVMFLWSRWCPHSGEGEDYLTGKLNFFTKTAVTPEQKVEKSIPRWEINRHAEG